MTSIRSRWGRVRRHPERGDAMAVFVATLAIPLMALIGLIADGGAKLAAINHANAAASQAARAAGQQLDVALIQQGAAPTVDVLAAAAAGQDVLEQLGVEGAVQVNGDQVTVTATATRDTVLLSLFGVDTVTGAGEATVRLTRGETS